MLFFPRLFQRVKALLSRPKEVGMSMHQHDCLREERARVVGQSDLDHAHQRRRARDAQG